MTCARTARVITTERPAAARHFDFVDSLRGIAVLGVLLVHTGQYVAGLPATVMTVTNAGAFGVQLFFVASAFTLFSSLAQRSRSEARPTLNYFLRRLFRIAPPFWLAILFYVWRDGMGSRYWAPHGIRPATVLATAAFAHGWTPTMINSVVPGGWSIAVEMNFYLIVPILFTRLTNLRRCVWFFIACVAGQWALNMAMRPVFAGMLSGDEQYLADLMKGLWLPTQLPVFAAGFALYYALTPILGRDSAHDLRRAPTEWPPTRLLVLLAAVVVVQLGVAPPSTFWGSIFAILAAALALHPSPFIVNACTRYLGTISYSGYLVHFAVLDVAGRILRHSSALTRYPILHLTVLYAAVVGGTVLVATATNRLVEEPSRVAGRRVIEALERRRTRALPQPQQAV